MLLPNDLERIVLRYAACFYPLDHIIVDPKVCIQYARCLNTIHEFFIQKWTPTACNVLRWVPLRDKKERYLWYYDPLTRLTPFSKREVSQLRWIHGLIPIFPGKSQTPSSRVRFNPVRHTNSRYFR